MSASGTLAILAPCPNYSQKTFRSVVHLAMSYEAAMRSWIMFARFAAPSPTTVARFLRAFRKESKRSRRCYSQDYMWLPSEAPLRRACRFSGWGRRCFVSSDMPSPSCGFSEISQVSMRSSKTINLSALGLGVTELSGVSFRTYQLLKRALRDSTARSAAWPLHRTAAKPLARYCLSMAVVKVEPVPMLRPLRRTHRLRVIRPDVRRVVWPDRRLEARFRGARSWRVDLPRRYIPRSMAVRRRAADPSHRWRVERPSGIGRQRRSPRLERDGVRGRSEFRSHDSFPHEVRRPRHDHTVAASDQ